MMTRMLNIYKIIFCLTSVVSIASFLTSRHLGLQRSLSSFQMNTPSSSSDWELCLDSPCKINLFLRIMGRRPTGYHDLASLFQAISLSDKMSFSKLPSSATSDVLICSDPSLKVDQSNLVIKALNLMRSKTGINQYFKVYLNKVVPMQAGLGGGSGNAATTMHAFNVLCKYPASHQDLKLWSGDIGSDITFFFSSGTAYCTGRGEIIESLAPLPDHEDVVVHIFKPMQGLSTALVFKTLQLDQCSRLDPINILGEYVTKGALAAASDGCLVNDLETPSFICEPILEEIKKNLKYSDPNVVGVMMSGSGTSIYGLSSKMEGYDDFTLQKIANNYDGLVRFTSRFINKKDDIYHWY